MSLSSGAPRICGAILLTMSSLLPASLAAQTATTVGTAKVRIDDVSPRHEFVGRVEAVGAVDIRTRIEGFIDQRLFDEGTLVEAGQPLFQIDARGLEIALAEAQARVEAWYLQMQRRQARTAY